MLAWIPNLDDGASDVGAGPVGPAAGLHLMLVGIGRIVAIGVGVSTLVRLLLGRS